MNKPGNHFAKKSMPAIKTNREPTPSRLVIKAPVALVAIFAIEAIVFHWRYWLTMAGIISGNPGPFPISKARLAVMAIIYVLFEIFKPSSAIWNIKFFDMGARAKASLVIAFAISCMGMGAFSQLSGQAAWLEQGPVYNEGIEAVQDGNQYNHLADALLSGSLSLDLPSSPILDSMENPYDPALRAQLNKEAREPIYWDYAYYDGSYYCYFGVVPCLLTFLPFKALTGMHLRTDIVVVAFACLTLAASALLLVELAKKYAKDISLGQYLIGFILLGLSCGVLEQAFLPRIYPIPILSALFFTYMGLYFWIKAERQFAQSRTWNKAYLVAGSFSIALTLGCRPQFVLACLLAFPIFFDEIKQREFFSVRGIWNTLAVIVPFLIILAPIAWYNRARFGSWTNFGASYNITGGDMTSYTFNAVKIMVQFLEYLFLPFQLISSFPYISTINTSPLLQKLPMLFTNEPFYAGFMFLTPVTLCLFGLLFKKPRRALKERGGLILSVACLAIAAFDIVVASYVSGTNMRYFADFAWLLLIPTVLLLWSLPSNDGPKGKLNPAIALLSLVGIGLYCWTFLGTDRFGALYIECPTLFNVVKNAVETLI
jgi:hypothetical protein